MAKKKSEKWEKPLPSPIPLSFFDSDDYPFSEEIVVYDGGYRMGALAPARPNVEGYPQQVHVVSTLAYPTRKKVEDWDQDHETRGLWFASWKGTRAGDHYERDTREHRLSGEDKRRQLQLDTVYPDWWEYGDLFGWSDIDNVLSEIAHLWETPEGVAMLKRLQREVRFYVTFPHPNKRGKRISVRDTTLAPILRKLVDNGIRTIEYSHLLRILKM